MKNIYVLSIIKFGILSILFIFSSVTLSAYDSKYIEMVDYPAYNSSNPDHVLIQSNADWSKINGSAHYYYVKPMDYRGAGRVTLTAKGTPSARRYIVLYDNRKTHPAKLSETEQANVLLFLNGAKYWTIHRISTLHHKTHSNDDDMSLLFKNGATNNIIDTCHIADYYYGIGLKNESRYNTIQRCRIADQSLEGRKGDQAAILMTGDRWNTDSYVIGNKILENEIKNANDGIQLVWREGLTREYGGTIIDGNLIWITPELYVRGVGSSVSDTKGLYSYSENSIDIKAGSRNANTPVTITNNIMWGSRRCATDGDPGTQVTMHYGAYNIKFEDNIIFDTVRGLAVAAGGVNNSTFKRNILYECNKSDRENYSFYIYDSGSVKIEENLIVDTRNGYGVALQNNSNSTFKRNVLISSGIASLAGSIDHADNYFYNTNSSMRGVKYSDGSQAKMSDFTFNYDNYTNSPKQKTLYGVVTTYASPHAGILTTPKYVSNTSNDTDNNDILITTQDAISVKVEGPWVMDYSSNELR